MHGPMKRTGGRWSNGLGQADVMGRDVERDYEASITEFALIILFRGPFEHQDQCIVADQLKRV
jgi:hypothetical protein